MFTNTLVYYPSIEYAKEKNELELWRESHNINMELKRYLEDNASSYYNTYRLNELMNTLVENYGVERSLYLIAKTVQYKGSYDDRFSKNVRDHAAAFSFPDAYTEAVKEAEKQGYGDVADKSRVYISDVHSCILNDVFRELMKMEQKQGHVQAEAPEQLGGMNLG